MNSNIDYSKAAADSRMAEIKVATETFRSDMETGYNNLVSGINKSQGDFMDALKEQIAGDLAAINEACTFYTTLLTMMQAAGEDFKTIDNNYAKEKLMK